MIYEQEQTCNSVSKPLLSENGNNDIQVQPPLFYPKSLAGFPLKKDDLHYSTGHT